MRGHVDLMSLAMNPRAFNTDQLVEIARELGVIAITPSVPTHLGMVNSITDFGEILEDSMEEHRIGHLDDLTNEEFNQVFTAAQNFCQRMTATAASK